jgi:hypothetical protein
MAPLKGSHLYKTGSADRDTVAAWPYRADRLNDVVPDVV